MCASESQPVRGEPVELPQEVHFSTRSMQWRPTF